DNLAVRKEGHNFYITFQGSAPATRIDRIDTSGLIGSALNADITLAGAVVPGQPWTVSFVDGSVHTWSVTPVAGDTLASIAQKLAATINTFEGPHYVATSANGVLHLFNRAGNRFTVSVSGAAVGSNIQTDVAFLTLQENGISYLGIETLTISTGTGNEVVNVQGTSAATTLHLNDGNERIYVSSNAAFTQTTSTDF